MQDKRYIICVSIGTEKYPAEGAAIILDRFMLDIPNLIEILKGF